MNFELNEEQQQIKWSVREFAESEIKPHVMEWDETQHFPIELRPKLAELGLMGVIFPEEYGGAGMGYIEYATIIEEIARVDGSVGLVGRGAQFALLESYLYVRHRRAKAKISRAARAGRIFRRVGFDRSASRFGFRRNAHERCSIQRRLESQRLEKFYHARDFLRYFGRRCRDR